MNARSQILMRSNQACLGELLKEKRRPRGGEGAQATPAIKRKGKKGYGFLGKKRRNSIEKKRGKTRANLEAGAGPERTEKNAGKYLNDIIIVFTGEKRDRCEERYRRCSKTGGPV